MQQYLTQWYVTLHKEIKFMFTYNDNSYMRTKLSLQDENWLAIKHPKKWDDALYNNKNMNSMNWLISSNLFSKMNIQPND